ncbi:uncharacterized protein LTR77_003160 [Saxophila tyrrhenica]|uniref:C6 zinc finger domain-containing protein n=1 Tax=Saxophila tyrrhenica TaxID=1690608 RepID=A0AAV9PIC4_9PEZI|nr:hypothetical protein LTR77_003160 [Saxophila tyrrhenica]
MPLKARYLPPQTTPLRGSRELMNSSCCIASFSPSEEALYLWQNALVDLSFQHEFLLDGILALSAIHKAVLRPEASNPLRLRSPEYIDLAIKSFRFHLDRPSATTIVPLFSLSSLLVVYNFAVAQIQPPDDPIAALCHMARLMKGIAQITSNSRDLWDHLLASVVKPLLISLDRDLTGVSETPELLRLRDWVIHMQDLDPVIRKTYLESIDELHVVFRNVRSPDGGKRSPIAVALIWPATLSPSFLDYLDRKDPVALVILAHFAILCRLHEDAWFMRSWGGWIFEAVEKELGPQYQSYVEWPRQALQPAEVMAREAYE